MMTATMEPISRDWLLKSEYESWIKEYFHAKEDLSHFNRSGGEDLELTSQDGSRGYVFIGPLEVNINFQLRMKRKMYEYKRLGKGIDKTVEDKENEIFGFSWRAN